MSEIIECETKTIIDVSREDVLEVPDLHAGLCLLDANSDGLVDFEESCGATLITPVSGNEIFIDSEETLALYDQLVQSNFHATPFMRFFPVGTPSGFPTAESWLVDYYRDTGFDESSSQFISGLNLTLADARVSENYAHLLFKKAGTEGEAFYFTLHFPLDPQNSGTPVPLIECNGVFQNFDLFTKYADTPSRLLARDILWFLPSAMSAFASYLPEELGEQSRDKIEAMLYQFGVLSELKLGDFEITFAEGSAPDLRPVQILATRAQWVEQNVNPVYKTISVSDQGGVPYPIDLRSESGLINDPILEEETVFLEGLLQRIPQALYGVLAKNGVLKNFSVEIIEDDVFDYLTGSGAIGQYFPWQHKFVIRRSQLEFATEDELFETILHELGHAVFPNNVNTSNGEVRVAYKDIPVTLWNIYVHGSTVNISESRPEYFLQDYWKNLTRRASVEKLFPSVSIYSLNHVGEFYAESTVAYLTGETDSIPNSSIIHGTNSRAELRRKLPEIYLAQRLLFEKDSRYFGNLEVFSWQAKAFYDAVLASPYREKYLSSETSGDTIAYAWEYWEYYGKFPEV